MIYDVTLRIRMLPGSTRPKDWHWPELLHVGQEVESVEVVSERRVNEDGTPFKQG